MKEASGELNMTVVTVVAIAAVAAFFYAFVWPSVKTSITSATKCSSAICPSNCQANQACACTYYEGSAPTTVYCKTQNTA